MYTNEFGQTIKADLAIVYITAEQLTELSAVVLNRMTQSSTPHIEFNVMEGELFSLEAEIFDLEGDALDKFHKVIPAQNGELPDAGVIAMHFIRFIFGEDALIHSFDEKGGLSIEIPFDRYISSTHGL